MYILLNLYLWSRHELVCPPPVLEVGDDRPLALMTHQMRQIAISTQREREMLVRGVPLASTATPTTNKD